MDRETRTLNLIKSINQYKNNDIPDYEVIKKVCNYFDYIKNQSLSSADLKFLKHISSMIGIPHYYEMLSKKYKRKTVINDIDLNIFSSFIYDASLHTSESTFLHKYQKIVLDKFIKTSRNRFFLSASTSFGKTHLVYEIMKKMNYNNIVLLFPTIALLSENLEKILSDSFFSGYRTHTLSDIDKNDIGSKNLFIYTPERFLSFLDKEGVNIYFDFCFIDEIYKIDNEYIIDEDEQENERDSAYRLGAYYAVLKSYDILLTGPYININSNINDVKENSSFNKFLLSNDFEIINFNKHEIVNKDFFHTNKFDLIDTEFKLELGENSKSEKLVKIIKSIKSVNQNSIVYCSTPDYAERYAKIIIESSINNSPDTSVYQHLLDHISEQYGEDWVLYKALKSGIGIHHGLIPKYIQKKIINLFNEGHIHTIFVTTTITEGVNTTAKNLLITHNKKGRKPLKVFDAKNIAGRAGRFLYHYNGNVIMIEKNFEKDLNKKEDPIKHKNYDLESRKSDIDIFHAEDSFLSLIDKKRRESIILEQMQRGISDEIFNLYKSVSKKDKIEIYDRIKNLKGSDMDLIKDLIVYFSYGRNIRKGHFQIVLDVIKPIVRNKELLSMIERMDKNNKYSILSHYMASYLGGGVSGLVEFKMNQKKVKDTAIREASKFSYNILKYQVVKYLGIFNIMYKCVVSQRDNVDFKEVKGFDRLLTKLEYNALTAIGKKASDYGVTQRILSYYDAEERKEELKDKFDNFEKEIFQNFEKILEKESLK